MEIYEFAIIGAGVIGSATAYYLSKQYGKKVILLEQFDFLHRRGSSHGDSRITRRTYPQDHYTYLMKESYKLWESAEKEAKTSVFTRTGGLDIAKRDDESIHQLIKTAKKHSISIQVLNPEEVNLKFPTVTLAPDHIGVYSAEAGILNASKAVGMFHSLARANGCILQDNTVVSEVFQVKPQGRLQKAISKFAFLYASNEKDQQLTKIVTNKGEILCKKCIITTGAWTKKFLKKINVDVPLQPIQTTVGYWVVDDPKAYSSSIFPVYIYYDNDASIYGFPAHEFPNMIKCAAHFGPNVDPDNRDFLPGDEDGLQSHVVPFLRNTFKGVSLTPGRTESCMYTWTPDHDFIIDAVPRHPGIFVACGFSGHGFKLAPIVGKILAQLAISNEHPFPKVHKHFSIDRFLTKSKM